MAASQGDAAACKHGYPLEGDVLAQQCAAREAEALCAERPAEPPEQGDDAMTQSLHHGSDAARGRNKRANRPVVFVADDARVVRTSELRKLYEIAGDQRTVAEALGVSVSTVCRALGGNSPAEKASKDARLRAVKEALNGD